MVIGADAGGMTAASQARRRRPDDLDIIAFDKGGYSSYSACGIPYFIGGAVKEMDDLIARTPAGFAEQNIEVRLRHEVTAVDLEARTVEVRDLSDGTSSTESFDHLMVATGAEPLRPPLPGIDLPGVFGVQTLDHGMDVLEFLEKKEPRRACVVGGGYIGVELAEAMLSRGLEVTLLETAPQPMATLDPDMGEWISRSMRETGITVYTDEPAESFEGDAQGLRAVVTSEQTIEADIVILGLGGKPNVAMAAEAGLPIGESGAVEVDRQMQTSFPGVWAAGDCAEKFHLVSRQPVAIPLGTHANKEGRTAGINIGGGYATFPGVIGTSVTKVCDLEVARTGLNEQETQAAGLEYLTVTVDSTTRAGYFPGAEPIKTKMIVEKKSGRLLGGQIIGREGAAKRIDVIATAIWNEMGVDKMLNMDLSYAPPFAPLWDPVLITARKAWQRVEESSAIPG